MKYLRFLFPPALLLTVIVIFLLIKDPGGRTATVFLLDPIRLTHLFGNTLNQTFLLLLPALGISLAFGTGVFNLGGEGQIYLGGMISWWFLDQFQNLNAGTAWILSWSIGALCGAALAGIAWLLKERGRIHELISTYLLSLGVLTAIDGWITGAAKDSSSYLMTTRAIAESHRLKSWFPPSKLNGSLLLILILVGAAFIFLFYRKEGYYWRITGRNAPLARYVGCKTEKIQRNALLISGGLHGLSGALIITGQSFMALQGFSAGLGWDGMAVALMAGLHPLGLLPAGFLFAHLKTGASQAHLMGLTGVNLKGLILALVFFFGTSPLLRFQKKEQDSAL